MNEAIGAPLMINSYSSHGFTLNNGMKTLGSVAIFPRSVLGWNVREAKDITEESLALFHMLEPKIDILVIGIGDKGEKFSNEVRLNLRLKKKNINIEILPTDQACATYNFMATEGRFVAAALIPPQEYVTQYHDMYAAMQQKKHQQYEDAVKNIEESRKMLEPNSEKTE